MPVSSHTLVIPITVTGALGPNPITSISVTLNTDSEADAIAQVLEQLGGADSVFNPNTVNTSNCTYS